MTKTKADVRVVRASPRHLNRVAELFDKYRTFYGCEPDPLVAKAFIAERFRTNDSVIFVAEVGRDVAGFAQLLPKLSSSSLTRDWILNDLYVDEAYRRVGAGTMLIDESKEYARAAGANKISLKTHRENVPAQELYRSHGWELDDRFLTFAFKTGGA